MKKDDTNNDLKTAVPLSFIYKDNSYYGVANRIHANSKEDVFLELDVVLNSESLGTISRGSSLNWSMKGLNDQGLIDKIGEEIVLWYA